MAAANVRRLIEALPGRLGWGMPLAMAAIGGSFLGSRLGSPVGHPGGDASTLGWSVYGGAVLLLAISAWRRSLWAGAVMLALLACAHGVGQQREGVLPSALAGHEFTLSGRIQTLDVDARRARFRFQIDDCRPRRAGDSCPDSHRVRLSWYGAPELERGERWELTARLRQPIGFANPETFDYGAWLWREGIQALGYVRDDAPRRLSGAPFSLRQSALARLDAVDISPLGKRWLSALTLGAGDRLDDDDWQLLNATGTTHLMVISGLHIGLIAALFLWLLRRLSRWLQPLAWRMTIWPWLGAGAAAFAYAGLAGFEPPAVRAAIMVAVGLWAASGRHAPGWWQAWWLALALVVICDPLAPWRPGLWLSFAAVAVLILAWSGRPRPIGWRGGGIALLRSQWLLAPIMAAAVLLAFGRLSPLAPVINLFAVPLVGSVMVPLGFLGWLFAPWPTLASWAWWPFDHLANILAFLLAGASDLLPLWTPDSWWRWPVSLALLLWGMIWLLPGVERTTRLWGCLLLALLVSLLHRPELDEGQLIVTVYDVGQGQLVQLETRDRRVLMDTGPRFASGFMPAALLWSPGQRFDDVIVTHSDTDHAGGIAALRQDHRVEHWWAPRGNELALPSRPCEAGDEWHDGSVTWRFLSPPAGDVAANRNDRSCVLLVTSGERRVLITGDASADRERAFAGALTQGPLGARPVDVLVAGHHGSATSSSRALIAAAHPDDVIFSSGRGNPFGHPAPAVVQRFIDAGSRVWNTAYDGAVRITLSSSGVVVHAQRHPGWSRRSAVDREHVGVESSP
ncbi:DNA internalization-related competence protein ComEC/Rec2 [Salinicola sp. MH3R3-1]|uniref:DNA internalization-related competence protein ComEC/Rec2 n=1 Tax=Salinicola sp. MH3R3-1 TaxID=1928762 RepID=UPI000A8929D5|nr:DNA internalization-related competence protein ComEC/Rec2 [Salinicola sp. MH3R3-1]